MTTFPENLEEINQQLDNELRARIPALTNSSVAEWRIWTRVFSIVIRATQVIARQFELWVNDRLAYLRPGTIGWYAEISRQFQFGDNLVLRADNSLGYLVTSPEKQIIAAVAVTENAQGEVIIKVARMQNQELTGLDQFQLLAFSNYIEAVKFVGTKTRVVSTSADTIRYNIEVFYNPAFDVSALGAAIEQAMTGYRVSLGFDGIIYTQRLIKSLMLVPGVVTVKLHSLTALPAGGQWQLVDVTYTTQAGYFNYDKPNNTLLLTPFNPS